MNRSPRLARLRVLAASAMLVSTIAFVGTSTASARVTISATVSGSEVVPGPGDLDANGRSDVLLRVDSEDPTNGRACVFYEVSGMEPGTFGMIGRGAPGDAGTIVATIPVNEDLGQGSGCVDGVDPAVVQAFNDDPT